MALHAFFKWLETSTIVMAISQSTPLTGLISGIHLLGLTLLVGGALVSGLKLMGALLPERPDTEVAGTAGNGMTLGLAISAASGLLLFATRASTVAHSSFFQLKMVLLFVSVVFFFAVYRKTTRRAQVTRRLTRWIGLAGLALWLSVALAGCAFILLE